MWGELSDRSYADAIKYEPDSVPESEARAIELLSSMLDSQRFGLYLATGLLYVRGNITGLTYRIEHGYGHGAGVFEMLDGRDVAYWCSMPAASDEPSTDHVVTVRAMLEGEELRFREIANRSSYAILRGRKAHYNESKFKERFGIAPWLPHEASFTHQDDELQKRDEFGVMVYRDCYFQPFRKRDGDQLELVHTENDALLDSKRSRLERAGPFSRCSELAPPHFHRAHEMDLRAFEIDTSRAMNAVRRQHVIAEGDAYIAERQYPPAPGYDAPIPDDPICYPGPRAENYGATVRFNTALRLCEGRAMMAFHDQDGGIALDGAGESYLQGFRDGQEAERPHAHAIPLPNYIGGGNYPLAINYPLAVNGTEAYTINGPYVHTTGVTTNYQFYIPPNFQDEVHAEYGKLDIASTLENVYDPEKEKWETIAALSL